MPVKSGYPPKGLTLVPELPLSSLGLQRGDQLTVTAKPGSGSTTVEAVPPVAPAAGPRPIPTSTVSAAKARTSVPNDGYVETEAGTLVHRVS